MKKIRNFFEFVTVFSCLVFVVAILIAIVREEGTGYEPIILSICLVSFACIGITQAIKERGLIKKVLILIGALSTITMAILVGKIECLFTSITLSIILTSFLWLMLCLVPNPKS
jgi:hypothetical protein